jgi:hypothetical protein
MLAINHSPHSPRLATILEDAPTFASKAPYIALVRTPWHFTSPAGYMKSLCWACWSPPVPLLFLNTSIPHILFLAVTVGWFY